MNKTTKLGGKLWLQIFLFGIVGQIAWVVENMYFSAFAQNLFSDYEVFGNMYYIATTLMVIFSALTATLTTIFIGGLVDRIGKRKVFISFGYILWGVTIMLFAAIPISFGMDKAVGVMVELVIFDCIMTFFGSSAYDAAYNTWITDITDVTNRGGVDAILSLFPPIATVIAVFVAILTFDKGKDNPTMYQIFFLVLGVIPIIVGIISIFTLKDSANITKNANSTYIKDTFYGFNFKVVKDNKMMYVVLCALCLLGISQQVYMPYILNFFKETLKFGDNYIIPGIGLGAIAGIMTIASGILFDKFGRKRFYIPLVVINVLSTLLVYLMSFMPESAYVAVAIIGCGLMLGSALALFASLMAAFQDYIPKGYEGRFQGVRMVFTVLLPMIFGPIISLVIGFNSFDTNEITAPTFNIFLAATVVAVLAIIPLIFVRKDADNLRNTLLKEKQEAEK